ncbi:N-acetylmannosamine kinase [Rodentibacter heidelbergensis]|uniref:N-acetylmannosamine kinase n=1 Tax=Rodentibacter heidelbergensis TaxID=1908258 RepID=A0A1V3IB75_9PAST|nr:N-acetylmannosamine kinase [Rodentibacter heidelbergensis]OOF36965.1 N-acetylmannosamine kinase [Rodentibacter heidelbergensis]
MRGLALDIGGTKIAAALVEESGIIQRQQIATPQAHAARALHQAIAQLMADYCHQFDYVAVASTGIINQGILTALNPKNLGGLAEFPLKASIARHTSKPIGLLNDVQAAAYAEYQLQDRSQLANFAFITVSTGVGGGLIVNHQLLTEPNGISGHIGHTLADPNGPLCGCGRRGCVEAIAAGRAIEAVASTWSDPCSPKEVFERFRKNDEKATALVANSARAIANLVADLKIAMDMQKIVIGGSVGLAEGYLPLVQRFLDEMPSIYRCEIESARLGQDAGLVGAARWVKDSLLSQPQDVSEENCYA